MYTIYTNFYEEIVETLISSYEKNDLYWIVLNNFIKIIYAYIEVI